MKLILTSTLFLLFQTSFCQTKDDWNLITTGKWMYELKTSPFITLYRLDYFLDSSGNKKSISSLFKEQNIDIDSIPYVQIRYNNQAFLVTKKNSNADYRTFKILKENPKYFILCNQDYELCTCKSGTFFYLKANYKLQRIEKPFSFSLQKNLLQRLKELQLPDNKEYEQMGFCEILQDL